MRCNKATYRCRITHEEEEHETQWRACYTSTADIFNKLKIRKVKCLYSTNGCQAVKNEFPVKPYSVIRRCFF